MARLLRANQWATLLLGVLSCLASGMSHGQAWEEMMEIRGLSIEQRAALRQKAVAGDSDASYRLALLYGDYESYDFAQYFFFLLLSAEQGAATRCGTSTVCSVAR